MIVDVHTYQWSAAAQMGEAAAQRMLRVFPDPWLRPDCTPHLYDAAMESVDAALVLGLHCETIGARIDHEQVAACVSRRPDKYLGLAGIDPLASRPLASLDAARALGLVGVVVSPAGSDFHPANTRAMALYEKCEALGLPVAVLCGQRLSPGTRLEFCDPVLFDEVARAFPTLRLLMLGFCATWRDPLMALLDKHAYVYADLSDVVSQNWLLYHTLLSAHQFGVLNKFLLGTAYPMVSPQQAVTNLFSLFSLTLGTHLPVVPREQLRQLVERDALGCLNIARPAAPVQPRAATDSDPTSIPAPERQPASSDEVAQVKEMIG